MATTFRAIFVSLILLSSFAAAVVAGPLEDAAAAMKRREYGTALQLLRPLADQGDAEAQARLAAMLIAGQGVPQDYTEAAKWFRKAADQGSAIAQFGVAAMYIAGRGVPQDHAEAVRWLRRAADHGDTIAQCLLGHAYATGQGVPQDDVDAVKWPQKAADQGNAVGQCLLGVKYSKARVRRRTTARLQGGFGRPPTKATPPLKRCSGRCTSRAKVCRRTILRL